MRNVREFVVGEELHFFLLRGKCFFCEGFFFLVYIHLLRMYGIYTTVYIYLFFLKRIVEVFAGIF